ncbi:hypothetical protein FA13DRAFT_1737237 [Coprinellus micaceus]|uniref:Uncharacterized protein n=1 Tax=Coprinellus micaceus TaxID=71717 RepID=A0A4Y7SY67_COPMI|nr:hypothetical protein FA13DRAFT_1737237 [Coprinellus micaceus]
MMIEPFQTPGYEVNQTLVWNDSKRSRINPRFGIPLMARLSLICSPPQQALSSHQLRKHRMESRFKHPEGDETLFLGVWQPLTFSRPSLGACGKSA